ncbi:hypothetical protein L484_027749 [Morus notabilis]|uniref:RNA-binding protein 48 n=1 Tax=Morus notabilis TaxID=981085 RepID=W9RCN3_9ROSA|nr:hypothetical protein L484_027749 [Morus notabilis]
MPRYKDEPPAVRVYTVCDESRCKPMDAEDCEKFTDVYWIKFRSVSNARFAKRKLDEYVFLGNRLNVSYAPHFETLSDTKEKLESRRKEVLARSNSGRSKDSVVGKSGSLAEASFEASPSLAGLPQQVNTGKRNSGERELMSHLRHAPMTRVSSDKEYFPSQSMNQTVKSVREKLNKTQSSGEHIQHGSASKKPRFDDRRRRI